MSTSPTDMKPLRPWLFAALYFTEGAPIGLLWWALPSVLRSQGVDVPTIAGLVALLGVPWALKFVWAPIIDLGRSPRWGYRDWIVVSQLAMGLFLLPVGLGWSEFGLGLLTVFLLLHAISAATQDVAIDGLCITSAPADERGRLNGWMQAGMLAGRSLFGGATLVLLEVLSFEGATLVLIGVLWVSAIAVRLFVQRDLASVLDRSSGRGRATPWTAWRQLVASPVSRRGLLFAVLSGASFEAVGTLAGPFLLDAGVATSTIGWFLGVVSVTMMGLGAVAGGRLADRWSRRRAVAASFAAIAVSVAALAVTSIAGWGVAVAVPMVSVYLSIGLFTASSYAWLMDLSHDRFAATQFSAFMGATNLCEVWSTAAGGRLIGSLGYGPTFLVLLCISSISLVSVSQGAGEAEERRHDFGNVGKS